MRTMRNQVEESALAIELTDGRKALVHQYLATGIAIMLLRLSDSRITNKNNAHRYVGVACQFLFCLATSVLVLSGQAVPATPQLSADYLRPNSLPTNVGEFVKAVGKRLESPGQELFTLSGLLTDSSGTRSVQVAWQLPGELRLTATGGQKVVFAVDRMGKAHASSALQDRDLILLESLLYDRPEAFFYALQARHPSRFLGARYHDVNADSKGAPAYDVYEVLLPITLRDGSPQRSKFYYFDSYTKLLWKVQYVVQSGGQDVMIETIMTDWSQVNGLSVPSTITVKQNGSPAFTLTNLSGLSGAKQDDSAFTTAAP